jgi:hypothetical protein
MGTTAEQLVETTLKVIDRSTGPLNKIAANAEKTAKAMGHSTAAAAHGGEHAGGVFETLAHTLSNLGGLGLVVGAGLSFHSALESTERYMENIKQIKELTGATVGETDFLLSSARRAGVPYESMQRTMFQLSRRGAMLEQTMAMAANRVPGMEKKFERLGVVMNKGPVKAIESMAAAVKKGGLSAGDLQLQFRIPQRDANDMRKFLERLDPKKLAAARKGMGGAVSEEDLAAFERMKEAQHRIADTWNRIKVTVISKLYPIAADMAEKLAKRMEDWLPKVQSAMAFVAEHMDQIVSAAKVFVAVMTAKKMMGFADKLMGGTGLVSGGKALVESIAKAVPMLGRVGMVAARGAQASVMANASSVGAAGMVSPAMLEAVGGAAAGFTILAVALAAVAAVVAVAYLGFEVFQKNIHGIGDRITLVWDRIKARFEMLWESVSAIGDSIAGLFGEGGSFGELIGYIAALSFDELLEGFDFLVHTFQTVASMTGELGEMVAWLWKDVLADGWKKYVQDPFMESMKWIGNGIRKVVDYIRDSYNIIAPLLHMKKLETGGGPMKFAFDSLGLSAPADLYMKYWNKTQVETNRRVERDRTAARADKKREAAEDTREKRQNFDFRGSRFDISQSFAEGYDPDRIAAAFANDLSSLGEMRVSSAGFAPITAVR